MKNSLPSHINSRIEKLDNRLANQIAAGEVVDRPASVLKELLENCIDAGAQRIEVEIERGGTRLIKVTDDGSGIDKDDLTLALTRHATSKIKKVEDLSAIYSLGFRGEALASISSVSRLTLTSRTHNEECAWQAISEGRDMTVVIQPASAVAGTRIEVRDLFFNTPARQKFLRTERTEFLQIEDVFKRMALANFDSSFILKHNGKIVKRVPAVKLISDDSNAKKQYLFSEQERSRLTILCGKTFSDLAIMVQCEHESVSIQAFVGGGNCHRSESDIQYVFINNRAVKDKTLTHAIKQAYQDRLPLGRMATYVIFLTIDANKIDVNVHPTKHEVRFENQREVHDLLFHSISEALNDATELNLDQSNSTLYLPNKNNRNNHFGETASNYGNYSKERIYQQSERLTGSQHQISDKFKDYPKSDFASLENEIFRDKEYSSAKIAISDIVNADLTRADIAVADMTVADITRLGKGFCIVQSIDSVWLIKELSWFKQCFLRSVVQNIKTPSMTLLFPEDVAIDHCQLEAMDINETLNNLGFDFVATKDNRIQLNGVPIWSKTIEKENIISFFKHVVEKLNNQSMNNISAIDILIGEWMIDSNSINYFKNLKLFDFESELDMPDSNAIKIDAGFAENLFRQKVINLGEDNTRKQKEEFEKVRTNVSS